MGLSNTELRELPISEYQKRFFLEWAIDPDSTKYNVSLVYKIKGDLNKQALKRACEKFTQDNEVVHARYSDDGENCFYGDYKIDDFYEELIVKDANEEIVHKTLRELLDRKFDLTQDILQKFYLIEASADLHYFILLANHHIITDATYAVQIVEQVSANYNDYVLSGVIVERETISFSKAIEAEKNILTEDFNSQSKIFWQEFIGDAPLNIELPYKSSLTKNISCEAENIYFSIDELQTQKIKKLARGYKTTPFILISAIYGIVLYKFTNQQEFLLSYPVDMRSAGFKDATGCFVNNLPLKMDLKDHRLFSELLKDISSQRRVVNKYQGYSMTHIINDQRKLKGELGVNYFNVGITQTNLNGLKFDLNNLEVDPVDISWSDETIDELSLLYDERSSKQLKFKLSCKKELFAEGFIDQFREAFKKLIYDVLESQDFDINQYSILSKADYQTIVYDWNQTDKDCPKDKTVYQLFEEQVEQNPDNIALIYEQEELTYQELNNKANQLARYIRKQYKQITNQELPADTLIPLFLERSLDMVIGILAVMKAGGGYVPMDPDYSAERFKHILKDTDAKLIITQSYLTAKLKEVTDINLIEIDEQDHSFIYGNEETTNLPRHSQAKDLAYVIYTSGTTGLPKGVLQTHGNVHRLLSATDHQFSFNSGDVWTLYHSYIFDFSVWELWGSLTYGAKLLIPTQELVKDISGFVEFCSTHKVTVLNQTPSAFYTFIDQLDNKEGMALSSLKYVIFGGDALNVNLLNNWWNYKEVTNLQTTLINMYGITETTVHVTYKEIEQDETVSSNIGRPIDDLKTYVLDEYNQPVPVGVIGELYIGGAGLARGYLNRSELTAERFISNPFATESDIAKGYTRLYKTGDLVRWLSDGNIEYIGRNDFQVKIRGYRIELGEIENQLTKINGIKQSVVLAKENTETKSQYLVGYYVPIKSNTLVQEDLLNQLSKVLPDYMVPSILVELDSLPLTVNGKLDRKVLPNPEFVRDDSYQAPTSELEVSLCNTFAEVLGLEKVGITDDFFRVGGNSILAIKLANRISKALDTNINVADIFSHKNVSKLSSYITDNKIDNVVIPRLDLKQSLLSFAQERLWFIEQYESGSNAYHIPMLVALNDDINLDAIKQSISSIVQRHQVLRSVFKTDEEDSDYQVVLNDELVINEYSYKDTDITKQIDLDINTPFDLTNDYPIRVSIYREEKEVKLLINIHHIASDGWSMDVLLKELNAYYDHYANNTPLQLSELSIQYKDFAVWQREFLQGEELDKQLSYWKDRLLGYETLNIPTDYSRPAKIDYSGDNVSFEIDEDTSDKLRAIAKENNSSLYSLMLSAFYVLLHKYTGQEDIVIGTPIANRHHSQTQDLIGFFVNSLGLREQLDTNKSIIDLLNDVHINLIEAQRHQDLPFERLVTALNVEQDQSRHPVFQMMFGLQSFGSQENKLFKPLTDNASYKVAKFDLECFIDDSQSELQGSLNYATALYNKETIERLVKSYQRILIQLTKAETTKIKDYKLLSKQDYQTIVYDWNKTNKPYPKDKTVYQLFEEQVEQNPNNITLVYEQEELTYKQLNN
ncbi:MAG: amino acid adenylation domain-containing protein [Francisella sp.]|jgi:amino acid adenylation domain-containing protein